MPRVLWPWLLASTTGLAAALAACGSSENSVFPGSNGPDAGNPNGGGGPGDFDDGTGFGDGGNQEVPLVITPADPVLTVTAAGTPATQQFTAAFTNGSTPGSVKWSVENVAVGTVRSSGLFTSTLVGGTTKLTAEAGNARGSTTVRVNVKIAENPANLPGGDQAALKAGGNADNTFKFLYPYDKTVFPRGLDAPVLQLAGTAPDAVYVRLRTETGSFEYEAFLPGTNPMRIEIPALIWRGLTKSAGPGEKVNVEVTKRSGGQIAGPARETWTIAQGSLKGIIYYNTYNSPAAFNSGAVMRIKPGANADVLLGRKAANEPEYCVVCHSVSANGNRLVAGVNWESGNPIDSSSYELRADGTVGTRTNNEEGRLFQFGGLSPDGLIMVGNGHRGGGQAIRGLSGDFPSRVYDATTGTVIDAPTFTNVVTYALTPAFSPDGTKLAFNNRSASTPAANGGRILDIMDVNLGTSPPVFSNLTTLVNTQGGSNKVVGWPSFTPDGKGVVYHEGDRFDTEKDGSTPNGARADLRIVDVATKQVTSLAQLNGFDGATFYLPYAQADEQGLNYEPTVLPVAVGGYYWIVFTSRRSYGNTIANTPGATYATPAFDQNSPRKKLWVAAIDINAPPGTDPSHPAFYLPGQELAAGNMRGFAALEPCKTDGSTCESGSDCCGGFCRQTGEDQSGAPVLQCVPPVSGCAQEDEKCTTPADCCDAPRGTLCLNGRCARPTPR